MQFMQKPDPGYYAISAELIRGMCLAVGWQQMISFLNYSRLVLFYHSDGIIISDYGLCAMGARKNCRFNVHCMQVLHSMGKVFGK